MKNLQKVHLKRKLLKEEKGNQNTLVHKQNFLFSTVRTPSNARVGCLLVSENITKSYGNMGSRKKSSSLNGLVISGGTFFCGFPK